jgi:hypothetical protein
MRVCHPALNCAGWIEGFGHATVFRNVARCRVRHVRFGGLPEHCRPARFRPTQLRIGRLVLLGALTAFLGGTAVRHWPVRLNTTGAIRSPNGVERRRCGASCGEEILTARCKAASLPFEFSV